MKSMLHSKKWVIVPALCLPALIALWTVTTAQVEQRSSAVLGSGADHPTTASPTGKKGWSSRGIGGGGALFSPSINPHDPDEIYISTDMSAVFRSRDFGSSWSTVSFLELQGGNGCEVRFTSSPNVLYSISHTDVAQELLTPMKSTDGGATWNPLRGDPTYGETYWLHAAPDSTNRLLLSDWDSLYFSADGGSSFRRVYTAKEECVFCSGAFWDGDAIFTATADGLLVSNDGGQTFTLSGAGGLPKGSGFSSFAGARSGGLVRFFAAVQDKGTLWYGVGGGEIWDFVGVYRLDWGRGNWEICSNGIDGDHHLFFVAMATDRVEVAYLGGGDLDSAFPVVYKTTDGGETWRSVLETENNANVSTGYCGNGGDEDWWYPEYVLGLAVCPSDADRVIVSDLGFAHVTSDGGKTWRQAYVRRRYENPPGKRTPRGRSYRGNGLEDTSGWWLLWPERRTVFAGFSDINGLRSTNGGKTWAAGSSLGLPHNTTYHAVLDRRTGILFAATSSLHDIYQSPILQDAGIDSASGAVVYSTDKGASWNIMHDFGHPVVRLALDHGKSGCLYAAVAHSTLGGVYVTHNADDLEGSNWSRLSAPSRAEGHASMVEVLADGSLLAAYSGRRDSSGRFTPSSGVFISEDGGKTWSDRTQAGMRYWTKDVVVDPNDQDQQTLYAAVFSHWGEPGSDVGGLYRSSDRGRSWKRIFKSYRVESIGISPRNPDSAYVSTEAEGLFKTNNLGSAKPRFEQDAGFPFKHPLRILYNPWKSREIWVTTFGNGLWMKKE